MSTDGGSFRIIVMTRAGDQVRLLFEAADRLGIRADLKAALDDINRRLQADPREWGDPVQELATLDLTLYRGLHAKLQVIYAVHKAQPIVFVRDVEPILNHRLASSDG